MKNRFFTILIVATAFLALVSFIKPELINSNTFLTDLISLQILTVQTVIVTVALALVCQSNLEYTRIGRAAGQEMFAAERSELKQLSIVLVASLFGMLLILICIGGLGAGVGLALLKSGALVLLTVGLLAMAHIVSSIAAIPLNKTDRAKPEPQQSQSAEKN